MNGLGPKDGNISQGTYCQTHFYLLVVLRACEGTQFKHGGLGAGRRGYLEHLYLRDNVMSIGNKIGRV